MAYVSIDKFNKMIKNAKARRQQEMRMDIDDAVMLLSEITEILTSTNNKNNTTKKEIVPEVIEFDAGGFK
tara:strand:- start:9223 stop:9432 length:210 start_codon:yes stop_codon:yes gene_type:complete